MAESDAPAVLLNYAAPARVPIRRWAWRLFLLGWAIFTLYLAYDWWWPWLRLQVPMLLAQRRCMRFVEPKDRVVFDSGLSWVGTGTGPYTSTTADQRFNDIQGRWDELKQLDELRNPQRDSDPSRAGNSLFSEPPDSRSIVFLHGLRSGGDNRLVVVWANWYSARLAGGLSSVFQSNESLSFWAEAIQPASLTGTSKPLPAVGQHAACEIHLPDPTWHMRLFAGQPDPADPSRFTIDYETLDGRGTVAGKLRPDGSVDMEVIRGPAKLAPATTQPEGPISATGAFNSDNRTLAQTFVLGSWRDTGSVTGIKTRSSAARPIGAPWRNICQQLTTLV